MTTTTTRTRQEIMDDIEREIREIVLQDLKKGADDYAHVRVEPDGTVIASRDTSWTMTYAEFNRTAPHPVTVWSVNGLREPAGNEDGVFEWEPCDADTEGSFYAQGQHWLLTETLVNELDMSQYTADIPKLLDGFDWIPKAPMSLLPSDDEVVALLRERCDGDIESDHMAADETLLELLTKLDYPKTVAAFRAVRKYYA